MLLKFSSCQRCRGRHLSTRVANVQAIHISNNCSLAATLPLLFLYSQTLFSNHRELLRHISLFPLKIHHSRFSQWIFPVFGSITMPSLKFSLWDKESTISTAQNSFLLSVLIHKCLFSSILSYPNLFLAILLKTIASALLVFSSLPLLVQICLDNFFSHLAKE